jgi:hypothetical protein
MKRHTLQSRKKSCDIMDLPIAFPLKDIEKIPHALILTPKVHHFESKARSARRLVTWVVGRMYAMTE